MALTRWQRLRARRDHRWVNARASEAVDGELTARAERRVEAHRDICPECDELLRALQALVTVLPALSVGPEDGLAIAERTAEHVRARISEWA